MTVLTEQYAITAISTAQHNRISNFSITFFF